jgi:hypothetical protein
MVEALIMGAAIRPRPVFVKVASVVPGWCASTRPQVRNCAPGKFEIPGSMLRIAPE